MTASLDRSSISAVLNAHVTTAVCSNVVSERSHPRIIDSRIGAVSFSRTDSHVLLQVVQTRSAVIGIMMAGRAPWGPGNRTPPCLPKNRETHFGRTCSSEVDLSEQYAHALAGGGRPKLSRST